MQILFVLENYYPNVGGVETLFKGLIEQLAAKGCKIKLITTQLNTALPKVEYLGNITIYRYRYFNRYLFTILAIFAVIKHTKNCNVVHTTSYNAAIPAFFGSLIRRKKTIITFHEVWGKLWFDLPYMNNFSKWLHYIFEQAIIKLPFAKFIAVSNFTKNKLIEAGVDANKVTKIYNGLEYTNFLDENKNNINKNNETFTMCYYGRLGISKGLDLILEAAKTLKTKLPQSKLLIVIPKTPKPFFEKILETIKQNSLEQFVELRHNLQKNELYKILKAVDCALIPSYSEGFCFAAAECVALGVPIISSHKGALKEVVSGNYIEMETLSTKGLLDAIEKAYNGNWQYKPVKKFHLTDSHQQYIALYEQLLNQSSLK